MHSVLRPTARGSKPAADLDSHAQERNRLAPTADELMREEVCVSFFKSCRGAPVGYGNATAPTEKLWT
ncbi:MAG: hypothetical protein PVG31_04900 [Methyloceanibacter sp.]|jgi:hypothetical protein